MGLRLTSSSVGARGPALCGLGEGTPRGASEGL